MILNSLNGQELGYLCRKLIYRLTWRELLARRELAAGWAWVPPAGAGNEPSLRPPIVFALNSKRYFHLGDAYFILPLALSLAAHFGRDQVAVCTLGGAREVFEAYGLRCVDDLRSPAPATLITFCEIFFEDLARIELPRYVYVNLDRRIDRPVADWHAGVFTKHFGVPAAPLPEFNAAGAEALAEAHGLLPRTVVVNDVVWSGKFRLRRGHAARLQGKVDELAASGHAFCRLGAAGEPSELKLPAGRSVDLRGRLSIAELIRLLHSPRVVASVSYDNFFMHSSLWAGKTAHILCRERPAQLRAYMRAYVYRASNRVSPAQLHFL